MNAAQLKRWKEKEASQASDIADGIRKTRTDVNLSNTSLLEMFPEFELSKAGRYTRSLEPFAPVWVTLPFFEKSIVTIHPGFRDERSFFEWYGVSPRQLLQLYDKGRVELRVSYPASQTTIPRYLNAFYEGHRFPSSRRDAEYTMLLLGKDETFEIISRFDSRVRHQISRRSIDSLDGDLRRAQETARVAYLQLHALGYSSELTHFQGLLDAGRTETALAWLGWCFDLLIAPVHYSMEGINTVANNSLQERIPRLEAGQLSESPAEEFPVDIGKALIRTHDLVQFRSTLAEDYDRIEIARVYDNSELASKVLQELHQKSVKGNVDIETVDDVRNLMRSKEQGDRLFVRLVKLLGSVGATAIDLATTGGILASLGYAISEAAVGDRVDNSLARLRARGLSGATLLMAFDDDVKRFHLSEDTEVIEQW